MAALTDTLGARWPLRPGSGMEKEDWIDQRIGYKRGVDFVAGEYTLQVVHAMRQDPLPGWPK